MLFCISQWYWSIFKFVLAVCVCASCKAVVQSLSEMSVFSSALQVSSLDADVSSEPDASQLHIDEIHPVFFWL